MKNMITIVACLLSSLLLGTSITSASESENKAIVQVNFIGNKHGAGGVSSPTSRNIRAFLEQAIPEFGGRHMLSMTGKGGGTMYSWVEVSKNDREEFSDRLVQSYRAMSQSWGQKKQSFFTFEVSHPDSLELEVRVEIGYTKPFIFSGLLVNRKTTLESDHIWTLQEVRSLIDATSKSKSYILQTLEDEFLDEKELWQSIRDHGLRFVKVKLSHQDLWNGFRTPLPLDE